MAFNSCAGASYTIEQVEQTQHCIPLRLTQASLNTLKIPAAGYADDWCEVTLSGFPYSKDSRVNY